MIEYTCVCIVFKYFNMHFFEVDGSNPISIFYTAAEQGLWFSLTFIKK